MLILIGNFSTSAENFFVFPNLVIDFLILSHPCTLKVILSMFFY